MSKDITSRTVINPRMRSSSRTIVPDEDYDDYPVATQTATLKSKVDNYLQYFGWSRPNNGNNRTVDPVLRNDHGSLINSNRPNDLYDDPMKPWV